MKKHIRIITALLAVCMIFGLAACGAKTGAPAAEETITIKMPHIYGDSHFITKTYEEFFKTEVEKRSNGSLKVELYPNSTLANEEEIYAGVRAGTYEMGIFATVCQDLLPQVTGLQLPFMFADFATAKEYLFDKGYGLKITDTSEEYGFKVLACVGTGFRVMTLNKRIENIEDFAGFKMRTASYQNMIDCFENLGCTVTAMPMNEVFTALEQKVVDGQENPPSTILSQGWYEIQDYMLLSNHVFSANFIAVNCDFWNKLSDEQREVLQAVATETAELVWQRADEAYQTDVDTMVAAGTIEAYYPSDELRQDMIDATAGMIDDFYAANPDYKELYMEMHG